MNRPFQTVVFYCDNFSMGGTETLLLRLIKYYKSFDYRVILLTITPIHESIQNDVEKVNFEHYIYLKSDFYNLDKKLIFDEKERPIVITQFMPEFLKCFLVLRKAKYGVEFRHLMYIVHPNSTVYQPKFLTFLARLMILILLKKNALVFMDETCSENCRKLFRLKKSMKLNIFRLPMFIDEACNSYNTKNEIFNILTISRFEFPFKGYILGLILSFEKLIKKYPSLSLTIIGHGRGKDEVVNLVSGLPLNVSSKITLLEKIPYYQINGYIDKCDMYVGMGTTILDAANNNKIAISAVAYQSGNLAAGFFHENYHLIGEVYRENISYPTFEDLIEKIIKSDEGDFVNFAKMSKSLLRKFYNINVIAEELLIHANGCFSILERAYIIFLAKVYIYRINIGNYIKSRWM